MKEKSQKAFNILILILLVLCLFKMNTMNQEITRLRNTINSNYNSIQNSINSISNNVRYQMEEANNLLGDSGWNTGGLNMEEKTATISCYVVPKVYNPKETAATIICNNEAMPMTLKDGKYIAELVVPLFEQTIIDNVQFKENGTIRTQQLDWSINPRYDMIPTAYMYYSGGTSHSYKGDIITRKYTGYAEVDFAHNGIVKNIKDTEIVMLLNGKEVLCINPDLEQLLDTEDYASYRTRFEHSIEVKEGDTIELYMTFTDDNGWTYRGVLEDITIGAQGDPMPEHHQAESDIYDAEGNLLFNAYEK